MASDPFMIRRRLHDSTNILKFCKYFASKMSRELSFFREE
jgi:hypothetical protein